MRFTIAGCRMVSNVAIGLECAQVISKVIRPRTAAVQLESATEVHVEDLLQEVNDRVKRRLGRGESRPSDDFSDVEQAAK